VEAAADRFEKRDAYAIPEAALVLTGEDASHFID
jgi:hypothetical protein